MTAQGAGYRELRQQLANTKAAYELSVASCNANLLADPQHEFEQAIKGWDLTLRLCRLEEAYDNNAGDDALVFSTSEEYQEFMHYAKDRLLTKTDAGGTFLQGSKNISMLSAMAGEHFVTGRTRILQIIQQPPR